MSLYTRKGYTTQAKKFDEQNLSHFLNWLNSEAEFIFSAEKFEPWDIGNEHGFHRFWNTNKHVYPDVIDIEEGQWLTLDSFSVHDDDEFQEYFEKVNHS